MNTYASSASFTGFALAVVVATVVTGLINAVIPLVGQALGADAAVIVFTLIGVPAGAIGRVIIPVGVTAATAYRRFLALPRWWRLPLARAGSDSWKPGSS